MVNLAGFVLLGLLSVALSSCPNHCNKNGVCDKYGRCTCDEGYQGADCSEKICPFGHAWSDVATATDVAHADAECSNRGICNRKNGKCKCMSGFSGSSCERLDCEDQCSNKGICYSMRDFASRTRNEMSQKFTYTSRWDSDKIKGCQCDYPATGYDCSQTLCPNGDDPLTTGQVNEVQLIHCASTIGSFVLNYDGVPSTAIPFTANAAMVRAALLSIPQITDVKVTFSQALGTVCQIKNNVISVEFTQQFGPLNPLVPIMDAAFDASGGLVEISADGKTTFADVSGTQFTSVKGTKEAEVCANRGLCDMQSGVCSCFDTNGDVYASSDGYGIAGLRGDCGFVLSSTDSKGVATCPGLIQCSGHGVCEDSTFQCHCSEGWYGGDCSLMACPQGRTWFAYPTADESAHLDYDTCSNMGSCDTHTGRCQCREGFYGEACQYMACGGPTDNVCNGHGRCMTMAELALWADDNGDATEYQYGSDPNNFATWDYDRVHGCRCDPGYSGYDCSLVDCPRGDDQGTYKDASEVQIVQCIADRGNFTLSFRQQKTARLQYSITAADLAAALNKLSTVKNVEVYFAKDGPPPDGILSFIMPQREKYPDYPFPGHYDNGVFVYVPPGLPNTGIPTKTPTAKPTTVPSNPPTTVPTTGISNSGFCDTTGTQIAIIAFQYNHGDLPALIPDTVNLADYVHYNGEPHSGVINVFTDGATIHSLRSVRGTTETDVCNNRGLCDTSTGMCRCFETWTSGDGKRQGGPGATADCGYRNDQLFTNF